MAKQLDDVATLELPIEAPKRGRGRPSTGKALSGAERMRAFRERQQRAVWCSDGIPVTVTGLLEQLRGAVADGYVATAKDLARQLVERAEHNHKIRNSDENSVMEKTA